MKASQTTAKISEALSKAQGMMSAASKDTTNTYFRSKYADLASVWEACRLPLSANGLSVVQFPSLVCDETGMPLLVDVPQQSKDDQGKRMLVKVETLLSHTSGEWFLDELVVPVLHYDAQGFGSGATYARRYGLMAMVGVAPDDDDDGNSASGRGGEYQRQPSQQQQKPSKPKRQADPTVGEQMQERMNDDPRTKLPEHEPADRILAKTLGKVYGCKTEEDCTALVTAATENPEWTWPHIRKHPDLAFQVGDSLKAYCEKNSIAPEAALNWVKGLAASV